MFCTSDGTCKWSALLMGHVSRGRPQANISLPLLSCPRRLCGGGSSCPPRRKRRLFAFTRPAQTPAPAPAPRCRENRSSFWLVHRILAARWPWLTLIVFLLRSDAGRVRGRGRGEVPRPPTERSLLRST